MPQLLIEAVKFLYFDVSWSVAVMKKSSENGVDVTSTEESLNIPQLRKRVTAFMKNCHQILTSSPDKNVFLLLLFDFMQIYYIISSDFCTGAKKH